MGRYAGVDWAAEKHDVLVADEAGEQLLAATFAHDEQGLRALCCQASREFPRCDHENSPPSGRPVRAGRRALMASRWRRMR